MFVSVSCTGSDWVFSVFCRCERLEEQVSDLTELHQNEILNLKQELASMEEKIAYQSNERARDLQVCVHRTGRTRTVHEFWLTLAGRCGRAHKCSSGFKWWVFSSGYGSHFGQIASDSSTRYTRLPSNDKIELVQLITCAQHGLKLLTVQYMSSTIMFLKQRLLLPVINRYILPS